MRKTSILFSLILFSLIILAGCTQVSAITNYEECVAAGYPVMESYPEKCALPDGRTFTRQLEMCLSMSIEQALITAQASDCATMGNLTNGYVCNESTETLWFGLIIENMTDCSPACVVDVNTGEVEINYRCAGLIISE